MIKRPDTKAQRIKRHKRVRAKVSGTPERPRLNVFRSEKNIYAQIIDDVVVMRMEEQRYWVSTLFRADMFVWFEAHKGEWDVHWEDVTKKWEMYLYMSWKMQVYTNARKRAEKPS